MADDWQKTGHDFRANGFQPIFSRVLFAFCCHHCRRLGTGGAVPAQGGHGAKPRGQKAGETPVASMRMKTPRLGPRQKSSPLLTLALLRH